MAIRHAGASVAVLIVAMSAFGRDPVRASVTHSADAGSLVQGPAAGVPQSVDSLVGSFCDSMLRVADEASLEELLADLQDVATYTRGVNDDAIAARDALSARYDALNAKVDALQAEREFLRSSTRERRGGLRSLVEQKLDTAQRLWTEGVGLEHRIAGLERGLAQAGQTVGGAAQVTLGWRGRTLPFRAFQTLRNLFLGNRLDPTMTRGAANDGRLGADLQRELRSVQAETVPAYAAKLTEVLGATPAPPIGRILGLLEREIVGLKQQLASEIAADHAANGDRLRAIDTELAALESERSTILASSDDIMREGRRAAAEKASWEIAVGRVRACADAARQRLRGSGGPASGSGALTSGPYYDFNIFRAQRHYPDWAVDNAGTRLRLGFASNGSVVGEIIRAGRSIGTLSGSWSRDSARGGMTVEDTLVHTPGSGGSGKWEIAFPAGNGPSGQGVGAWCIASRGAAASPVAVTHLKGMMWLEGMPFPTGVGEPVYDEPRVAAQCK